MYRVVITNLLGQPLRVPIGIKDGDIQYAYITPRRTQMYTVEDVNDDIIDSLKYLAGRSIIKAKVDPIEEGAEEAKAEEETPAESVSVTEDVEITAEAEEEPNTEEEETPIDPKED